MWCKNVGRIFCFVTIHGFDRQSNGQTGGQMLIERPQLCCCSAVKTFIKIISNQETINLISQSFPCPAFSVDPFVVGAVGQTAIIVSQRCDECDSYCDLTATTVGGDTTPDITLFCRRTLWPTTPVCRSLQRWRASGVTLAYWIAVITSINRMKSLVCS